jgi:hypothetical protein
MRAAYACSPLTIRTATAVIMRGAPCRPRVSELARSARGTGAATSSSMTNDFETLDADVLDHVHGGYSQALFSAMQQAVSMGLKVNSTYTGGHAKNSMHYKGRAFDATGSPRQMQAFYNWAAHNTHPHELIHRNHFLKDGHAHHAIGGHNNHVHFSI